MIDGMEGLTGDVTDTKDTNGVNTAIAVNSENDEAVSYAMEPISIDGEIIKQREMVCIVCPRGCKLTVVSVDRKLEVSGNFCPRGKTFAIEECTTPKRTISSTVATVFKDAPIVPVRVSGDIPKDMIFKVMDEIKKVKLTERIGRGKPVIKNVLGLNVDVIVTSEMMVDKLL